MTELSHVDWPEEVQDFWFRELEPKDWFAKNDALDARIVRRFGALHEQQSKKTPGEFLSSTGKAFSAIILFDQLSRNIFRDDPRSFRFDPLALSIARSLVAIGQDQDIAMDQRIFAYLPFEHSEDLADQHTSVKLIEALGDAEFTRYAHAHRDVIARFGRFPHRNAILGRASTPEEEAFLRQPGSGF